MPHSRLTISCLSLCLVLAGCRQVITRDPPEPPPFPPNLETVVTLESGLVLRAFGEIVSSAPTVLRITATVTNPTDQEIVAQTLQGGCELIVLASWPESPFLRLVQPLDGMGVTGGTLGVCGNLLTTRVIAAGETIELSKSEDLVLSAVLGPQFVPGRYVISAIFVDQFIYEALALDTQVPD